MTNLRLDKYQNRSVILLLLVAFIVQAYIASWPDTMGDVKVYRFWCRTLVNEGLAPAYWDSSTLKELGWRVDYPPIYPYMLYGIGKAYKFFAPGSFEANDVLLDFFLKLPAIFSNIITSLLIFISLKMKTRFKTAFLVMSAYALNPAIIFDATYWGQTDAINALFVVLSIIFLSNKMPEWSWVSITLGVFMKPLAYPFAPVIVLFTLKQFGVKRTLRCALTSIITTFVILLPFIHIDRLPDIIYNLFFQLEVAPYVSVDAHNIWWIIGGGLPWVHADIKPFGLISYSLIGIALFGIFYVVSLLRFWKSNNEDSLYYLSASVAFGFFMLSTHMHENHLFTFFPLLSMVYFSDKRLKWIYMVLSFTFLANMVLHSGPILEFISSLVPVATGPILRIPDLIGEDISLLRLFLTILNAQINILIFCYWIYYIFLRERALFNLNLFDKGIKLDRLSLIKIAAIVIIFISVTSIPVIVKAARIENEQRYLLLNFDPSSIKAVNNNYVDIVNFMINNDMREVLFEHPPARVTYKLLLPEKAALSFGIALNPETWSPEKGDGVLFELYVQDGGSPERAFSKYIDPKHNIDDRIWHDEVVDLSRYGGNEVSISFVTTPGFNNNSDFDWAGWSNPRIITSSKQLEHLLVK